MPGSGRNSTMGGPRVGRCRETLHWSQPLIGTPVLAASASPTLCQGHIKAGMGDGRMFAPPLSAP
jgi:hypothetical protein